MYMHYLGGFVLPFFLAPVIVVFAIWSVFWKGLALWHAARRGQPWWFVIMLIINTVGILEIIYLFLVAQLRPRELFSKAVHHNHRGHHS